MPCKLTTAQWRATSGHTDVLGVLGYQRLAQCECLIDRWVLDVLCGRSLRELKLTCHHTPVVDRS